MTESTVTRKREGNTEEKGADVIFAGEELEESRLQGLAPDLSV